MSMIRLLETQEITYINQERYLYKAYKQWKKHKKLYTTLYMDVMSICGEIKRYNRWSIVPKRVQMFEEHLAFKTLGIEEGYVCP